MVTPPRLRAALIFVGLTALAPVAGAEHDNHAAMKGSEPARADLGSSAVFDGRGNLWAVSSDGEHVILRRSRDRGKSWSGPRRVNPEPEAIGADGDAHPKIALGRRGELYVTWTHPLSKPYTGEIRFARSLDGGKTFDAPVVVHQDRQEITHRFDALTVNATGTVFIAWIDKRDLELAKANGATYRGAAVYFAVSDDRGANFRGDHKLADYSCECCRIALAPRRDGSVAVFWRHVFEPDIRDHALSAIRADGTHDEVRRATQDNWNLDACPHHGPALAIDASGRYHAAWFTDSTQRQGLYYAHADDGATFDAPRAVGDASSQPGHPALLARGKNVYLAWKEFDGTTTAIRTMVSSDGGTNWSGTRTAATTQDASDHPQLLNHGNAVFLAWNTKQEGYRVVALTDGKPQR